MDEITKTNTSRILTFLQHFELDFNDYTLWNYSRKKFHERTSKKSEFAETLVFFEDQGWVEKVRRPGYYHLTEKGKNFEEWNLDEIHEEVAEPAQNSWSDWLFSSKK